MARSLSRLALAAGLALSSQALATWSMIIIDTRTGEVAVGSCTCLTGIDLQALTPVLITGVGAAAAQSAGDSTQQNRTFIRDLMWRGTAPADIITALSTFDLSHQSRQYGIADVQGRTATFTGSEDGQWAGGQTGSIQYTYAGQTGTIVYSIQGNVLTGAPVVQAAVDALSVTPGDVPTRFMAAMEAARSMGGDGRCSCPGGVTTCGSPPPNFTLSAHIGYMLIARAGDKDGCSAVYASGPSPSSVAAADLDGDGLAELVAANHANSSVSIYHNITPVGSPFAMLAPPTSTPTGVLPNFIALADMNGNGVRDLVTANSASVSVCLGLGGMAFGPSSDTPIAGTPSAMVLANFDGANGLDVSCPLNNATLATLLNDGSGHLLAPLTRSTVSNPGAVATLDIDGNGTMDVVIATPSNARLLVLRGNGNGTFTAASPIVTPPVPTAIGFGDFNHDGSLDIICANAGTAPSITVYFNNGSGAFTLAQTIPITPTTAAPNDIAVADLDGDGNLDAVVSTNASKFFTLMGLPSGAFTLGSSTGIGFPISHITVADMNGDGKPDVAYAIGTQNEIGITNNRGDGTFQPEAGTAGGNYFMSLNVPNALATDPDPVTLLHAQFDAWRATTTGHPDAVQSLVTLPQLDNYHTMSGTMTVTLRDWQGQPITVPIDSLTVTRAPGSQGVVTIGAVTNTGPGAYSVALSSSSQDGTDTLVVTADDSGRNVILMPRLKLTVTRCTADFNGDGDVGTDADIEAFFACLAGNCCPRCLTADINGDGDVGTDADIELFFNILTDGCVP